MNSTVSCAWKNPGLPARYLAAASLHSHTQHSKESLGFILKFTEGRPILRWALDRKCKRAGFPVDLAHAYWTPPVSPGLAFAIETRQIEHDLGLKSIVSITDHDTIEAPATLRALPETAHVPVSLEWTVPFEGAAFHLGIHNLPENLAQAIVADLASYTRNPSAPLLRELLAMLDGIPDVLVVFNHPLWDLEGLGEEKFQSAFRHFLEQHIGFIHALELNATRDCKENRAVMLVADQCQRPVISGGDRHGCRPSAALNLTRVDSFPAFVNEIRVEKRSHVLFMPSYAEPRRLRITEMLLDVLREYPDFPVGSQRWDDRVYHLDRSKTIHRPISKLWKAPPVFLERIFSTIRLLENSALRLTLSRAFNAKAEIHVATNVSSVATDVSSEVVS
jgi:hypothetical protein